jgi:dolichyl-phosphate-mannose-protein mannosyltransferase
MTRAGASLDAAWCTVLAIAALVWFSLSWDATLEPRDEGYLFAQSERVALGALPHRDVQDIYGPLVFPLTGAVLEHFDGEIVPVRIFLAAWKATGVVLAYLVLRQLVGRSSAIAGCALAIVWWGRPSWNLNAPMASLYTLPIAEFALLLLVVAERRDSPRWRAASGVVAGIAMLFKQSLGIMHGATLGLALVGAGMLREPADTRTARATPIVFAAWAAAALLLLVPVWRFVDATDYLVHLLPIHALMGVVAVAVARRGATGAPMAILRRRVAPWTAGIAAVWVVTLVFFAAAGGLEALLYDMFVLPGKLVNYRVPVELPSPRLAAFAAAGVTGIAAVVALIGWRVAVAATFAAIALLLVAVGRFAFAASVHPTNLMGVQLAAIGWAGIALVAARLLRHRAEPGATSADGALVALTLFHLALCFQGFPRAGVDLIVAQGPQALLFVVVLAASRGAALGERAGRTPRVLATVALALVPLWFALPVVRATLLTQFSPQRRAIDAPHTHGIRLFPETIRAQHIRDFEQLEAWLATQRPSEAPLFVVSNQGMIGYASGRPALFPEQRAQLLWIGWGLLPPDRAGLDEGEMIARLAARPETIVIDSADASAQRVRRALPALAALLQSDFEERARFGIHRVLVRR